jgi:hypothetical protein
MKLWLVSFLILFFGAEAAQWFAHLHWFSGVELSLPAVVIGGIGLAIASNYRQFQALGLLPDYFSESEQPSPEDAPRSTNLRASTLLRSVETPSTKATVLRKKENSISFEIRKPKSVSFEINKSRQP